MDNIEKTAANLMSVAVFFLSLTLFVFLNPRLSPIYRE